MNRKKEKLIIKIKDVRRNSIIGKVQELKLARGKTRGYDYFTSIEMKGVKFKRIRDEELHDFLEEFALVIMNEKNEVLGEYDVDGERDSIRIIENEGGEKAIRCKVKMGEKLNNPILELWQVWDACTSNNLWGEWTLYKRSQWIRMCYTHDIVNRKYYEDSIYFRERVDTLYLDGTYIVDSEAFFCALGEAFWGTKGYYGGAGMQGYGYLHDHLAMEKYTTVYWSDFRSAQDISLLYCIELLVNVASVKLVVEPSYHKDEGVIGEKNEKYLNGTHIIDEKTFFKALNEAMLGTRGHTIQDIDSLKDYLEEGNFKSKKTILWWLNYKWKDEWQKKNAIDQKQKNDEPKEILRGIELLGQYNIRIIFLPGFSNDIEDIDQLMNHVMKKDCQYKPLRRYIQRYSNKRDPFIMELLGLSPVELDEIIQTTALQQKKIYVDMIELEEAIEEAFSQGKGEKFEQLYQEIVAYDLFIKGEDIIRLLKIPVKIGLSRKSFNYYFEFSFLLFITFKTNDEQLIINELTTYFEEVYNEFYSGLSEENSSHRAIIVDRDSYMGNYLSKVSTYPFEKENFELFLASINHYPMKCKQKIIQLLIKGPGYPRETTIHMLETIELDVDPLIKLDFILEYIGKYIDDDYEVPLPIIDFEVEEMKIYYGKCDPIISFLEQYGEDYSRILLMKLKKYLNSVQLWKMYYRDCLRYHGKDLKDALELINKINLNEQFDEYDLEELLAIKDNLECICRR